VIDPGCIGLGLGLEYCLNNCYTAITSHVTHVCFDWPYLHWDECEGYTDHEEHEDLGRPDVRRDVAISHRRKRHNNEVHRVKQVEPVPDLVTGPLDVLDTTDTGNKTEYTH